MDHTDQNIAKSIDYLVAHYDEPIEMDFPGVNQARLQQYMNMNYIREFFSEWQSGHGIAPHMFVSCKTVTPGEAWYKGKDLIVTYGFHPTRLGEVLVGKTPRGICYLGFLVDKKRDVSLRKMKEHLSFADFQENNNEIKCFADDAVNIWEGHGSPDKKLALDLHGTDMQIKIWQALLEIPAGQTVSYGDIAKQIGKPKAARAVGSAVGANPVSLLVPCHRVIQASGIVNNYGWGNARKKLLLGLEGEF